MTDPIADFLTRIRNAQMAGVKEVHVPYSTVKENIAKVLEKNGFLASVKKDDNGKFPELVVTRVDKEITLKRISKPGQRIYVKYDEVRKVLNGFGIAVISTSKGLMTGYEARAQKLGGEYVCEVS
ncbi:MAG TPA: 30S ribosomal protein S8 [Candidatus Gracilibacteria bacterium]